MNKVVIINELYIVIFLSMRTQFFILQNAYILIFYGIFKFCDNTTFFSDRSFYTSNFIRVIFL